MGTPVIVGGRHPCETARRPPDIVLLGSTGFVGSAVRAQLAKAAIRVIGVSNDPRADRVLDLLSAPDLTSAIPQGAVVVNLAYMWNAGESANRAISRNIADGCTQAGAARLVHCSTAAVAGRAHSDWIDEGTDCRPFTAYGKTKLAMESDCLESKADVVILRPTSIFGPGGNALAKLAKQVDDGSRATGLLRRIAFGRRAMNLISLENTVAAIRFAIDYPKAFDGRAFYVSDDEDDGNDFATVHDVLSKEIRGSSPKRLPAFAPSWMLGLALRALRRNSVNPSARYSSRRLLELGCPRPKVFLDAVRDYGRWFAATVCDLHT
jgi:nucleoside-diphosphate-sugar epimerase